MVRCSCGSFNLVRLRMKRMGAFYRSKGMKSHLINLDNGSTMHCWVQTETRLPPDVSKERVGRSHSGRSHSTRSNSWRGNSWRSHSWRSHLGRTFSARGYLGRTFSGRTYSRRSPGGVPSGERQRELYEDVPRRRSWMSYAPSQFRFRRSSHGSFPGHGHAGMPPPPHGSVPPHDRAGWPPPHEGGPPYPPPHDSGPPYPPNGNIPPYHPPPGGGPPFPPPGNGPPFPPHGNARPYPPPGSMPPQYPPQGGIPPYPPRRRGSRREGFDERVPFIPLNQRPALVFLHGFGGDGTLAWEKQIATFTMDYKVFVPDLLYFGASTTKNVQRTEIFQADCIMEMLTKLNVQKVHVVGASYGGFVAFWMAYKYPDRCRKLVLCNSAVTMTPRTNDPLLRDYNLTSIEDIMLPTTVDGLKLVFSLVYERPPSLPDFMLKQFLDVYYRQEDRPQREELLSALIIGSEKCPELPVLNKEMLIVWGRLDKLFKLPLAHDLDQRQRDSRLAIIEHAGHMPYIEKPKEFNYIVNEFLAADPLHHDL